MKYFDETAAYWGDSFEKIVRAGNNRLSVRSVKIFADGMSLAICTSLSAPSFPGRLNPKSQLSVRLRSSLPQAPSGRAVQRYVLSHTSTKV